MAVFQSLRSPYCDIFINRSFNFQTYSTRCSGKNTIVFSRNMHLIQELLLYQLDSLGNTLQVDKNSSKILQNLTMKNFLSRKDLRRYKHDPISASISSNFLEKPVFPGKIDPHHLIASNIEKLQSLAPQSERKRQNRLLDIGTVKKLEWAASWVNSPNVTIDSSKKKIDKNQDDCKNGNFAPIQFSQT